MKVSSVFFGNFNILIHFSILTDGIQTLILMALFKGSNLCELVKHLLFFQTLLLHLNTILMLYALLLLACMRCS